MKTKIIKALSMTLVVVSMIGVVAPKQVEARIYEKNGVIHVTQNKKFIKKWVRFWKPVNKVLDKVDKRFPNKPHKR